jgi:ribosomal-protein-alanine acetyltransferase
VLGEEPAAQLHLSPEAPEIIAFLIAHRIDAEWELENIVVAETARRRGLGTLLLRELITHARTENVSGIFLEVRESNQTARALYRKLGFKEVGLRKGYYANPPNDAILCRLSLS